MNVIGPVRHGRAKLSIRDPPVKNHSTMHTIDTSSYIISKTLKFTLYQEPIIQTFVPYYPLISAKLTTSFDHNLTIY